MKALILALALLALSSPAAADPSPTATATLLNAPTYGGYAAIRATIDGHVKFPAGVVWCSQNPPSSFWGYWEVHYPSYQKTMDVTWDYGPLMTPGGTVIRGEWDPTLPASCSFTVFAESQGKNGKGPFAIDGGWVPFNVPGGEP